jgi:hypothetical protein
MLAATTDRVEGLKKAASATLRATESVIEAFGGQSPTVKSLGGQPLIHILGETYYSQAPILYGPYMAKIAVVPVSPALTALTDTPLDLDGDANGIRRAVVAFFAHEGGEWELRVQLRTDAEAMPIEDASVVWPEDKSPYRAVARIRVAPQEAWSQGRASEIDDGLSFSPWHGLMAHRPLGSVMRARKRAYELGAEFRAEHNRCPIAEPRSRNDIR